MTIAKNLHFLSDLCKQNAESVTREIADQQNDPRSMCFWNIYNRVKISEEIMSFYEMRWGSDSFLDLDSVQRAELVERVMVVTKDLFVDVVSAVEKATKDCVGIYKRSGIKEDALKKSSHLYLRNIMEICMNREYIDRYTFNKWDNVLVIRNLIAHNNSIADRNKRYEMDGIIISMRAGRMMKGPLDTFIILTHRVVNLFYEWLIILHSKY